MELDLVLTSGGVDSLVCVMLSVEKRHHVHGLFVRYGHPAQAEEHSTMLHFCGGRNIPTSIQDAPRMYIGPMETAEGASVVPARNAVMLSLATNTARRIGATRLVIGASGADFGAYPDCRREFFDHMQAALAIEISTPLIGMNKMQIVQEAARLGIHRGETYPCYRRGPKRCGECNSCREADQAWAWLQTRRRLAT